MNEQIEKNKKPKDAKTVRIDVDLDKIEKNKKPKDTKKVRIDVAKIK